MLVHEEEIVNLIFKHLCIQDYFNFHEFYYIYMCILCFHEYF